MTAVTIKTYATGGGVFEVCGVRINVGKSGEVFSLSAWDRADELCTAGVLSRKVWKGNGLFGHDVFTYSLPMPTPQGGTS